ncbi:Carboxypeptidase S1-like protein B [Verticillium dahliae VDG1]|nr:putative serine-rich protein C11G7.01 [Verticillium dahliae VDG2]KAF3353279.1 Carboxypeptidase S1-like protein B [Verticillium dahliae VDG1]
MSPSTTTRSSKATPATRSPRIDKSRLSWTATRCHRLLRPLQNRIAALRKEIYVQERTFPPIHPENLNGSAKLSQKRKISEGEQLHETKRPCRTYSKRQATGADYAVGTTRWGHEDQPRTLGGPMPQTPIFRRTKLVKAEKDVSTQASKDGQGTRNRSSRSMSYSGNPTQSGPLIVSIGCLRKAQSPVAQHRYVHYESMLRILDTLLRATATPDSVSNTKSLLHMCLRKIPEYAAGVEAWEANNASRTGASSLFTPSSATTRLYTDLEQMSGSDAGWKYFASLVRAHALWVIREAITEGLIEPVFAGIIAHHYNQFGYTDDASTILETTAERTYPAPRSLRTSDGVETLTQHIVAPVF